MRVSMFVYVEDADRERFKAAAEREGLSLSAWIRQIAKREARKMPRSMESEA